MVKILFFSIFVPRRLPIEYFRVVFFNGEFRKIYNPQNVAQISFVAHEPFGSRQMPRVL